MTVHDIEAELYILKNTEAHCKLIMSRKGASDRPLFIECIARTMARIRIRRAALMHAAKALQILQAA